MGGLEPLHAWLPRVNLPWMDVEDIGPAAPQNAPDAMREQTVREETKVATARPRYAEMADPERAHEDLVQSWPDLHDAFAAINATEPAVAIMRGRGKGGRIVLQTEFLDDIQGPVGDAEGRRPIAANLLAARRLEEANAALDILAESGGREGVEWLVPVAVAGQLVPGGSDPPDQSGTFFGQPAKYETGAARTPLGHELQHAFRVALDPQFPLVPGITRDHGFQIVDVEPVLDIDG